MADQAKVIRGLQILQLYKPDRETWECDAQHDVLYAQGRHPDKMDAGALRELAELGWSWDGETDSWKRYT